MERFPRRLLSLLNYRTLVTVYTLCTLSASVSCGRCQREAQTLTPLTVCNFSRSAVSSLLNANFSRDCQFLDLSQNQLQTVDEHVFSTQENLLYLDLSFNKIAALNPLSFIGLDQLVCLDLSQNKLNFTYEAFPKVVFLPLNRLNILDIGYNLISSIQATYPDISFQELDSLEEIRLDLFHEMKLGPGFSRLLKLKTLEASRFISGLDSISADYFISFENLTISTVLLASCSIKNIEPKALRHFRHLKHISLTNNRYLGLRAALNSLVSLPDSLSSVDLRSVNSHYSDIGDQFITKEMGKQLSPFCLQSLDLSDNMIVRVEPSSLLYLKHECLEIIQISNLYLLQSNLIAIYILSFRFQNIRIINIAHAMIRKPNSLQDTIYSAEDLLRSRRAAITISFQPKLEILNMSHTYLHCHASFQDIVITNGPRLSVLDISYTRGSDCFHRRFIGFEHLKSLLISGNNYADTLDSTFFSSFPNLTSLTMCGVNLMSRFQSDKELLRPLKQVQHLHMANSGLTSISTDSLSGLLYLKSLDLSFNNLISVPDVRSLSPNLEILDMRSNALISIPLKDREKMDASAHRPSVLALSLNGNPLVCNCDTYGFVEWVWTSKVVFDRLGNYSCIGSNGSVVPLLTLKGNFRDLRVRCVSSFWVTFGALAVSLLAITLLVSAVVYRYRVPIKYWYHTLCRKPKAKPDQRHKYHALVAYCHQDYRWVCETLYPKLTDSQQGNGYKLCVYDRDFLPGVPIEENIITAINSSFKIILVISPGFVKSTWCQFELQMARMKMIQVGREDVVIPIILQDVPVSSMPKSLLNLWNTSVFLVWSETPGEQRHFWENLMAALGPVTVGEAFEDDHNDNIENEEIINQEDEPIMVLNPADEELLLLPRHSD